MIRRLRCATFANTKCMCDKVLCVILVLFLLYYVCMIKQQLDQSSRTLFGGVQEELTNISTKEKQGELNIEKGFNTNVKQKRTPVPKIEAYLKQRLTKIKQSCGDVCKTDQNVLINGKCCSIYKIHINETFDIGSATVWFHL